MSNAFRNVPVLLWIVFLMAVLIESLAVTAGVSWRDPEATMKVFDSVAITNRGIYIPEALSSARMPGTRRANSLTADRLARGAGRLSGRGRGPDNGLASYFATEGPGAGEPATGCGTFQKPRLVILPCHFMARIG